ncbi:MAG: hypothetical protein AAF460_09210 [Pseudomonadota bacterium]
MARTLAVLICCFALGACSTVDLEADPLLRPPQLIDTEDEAEKKPTTALAPTRFAA